VFGLPGNGINGLLEARRTHQDQIRFIQVRHEEAAAFAKYTGRLGVCMATSAPGGIHLLNGLYDAKLDNQPVLAVIGHTFHLPVKVIIIKNNVLGMITLEQIALEGNPEFGVELRPIDFAAYARACGIEATVDATEPPLPGHVTTKQA
jgi:thiamine pyrophosphate-dependent acetolactate synthase large subunit-like protein